MKNLTLTRPNEPVPKVSPTLKSWIDLHCRLIFSYHSFVLISLLWRACPAFLRSERRLRLAFLAPTPPWLWSTSYLSHHQQTSCWFWYYSYARGSSEKGELNPGEALLGPVCVCGEDCWRGLQDMASKVLVVGSGVIGLRTALELLRRNVSVCLVSPKSPTNVATTSMGAGGKQ